MTHNCSGYRLLRQCLSRQHERNIQSEVNIPFQPENLQCLYLRYAIDINCLYCTKQQNTWQVLFRIDTVMWQGWRRQLLPRPRALNMIPSLSHFRGCENVCYLKTEREQNGNNPFLGNWLQQICRHVLKGILIIYDTCCVCWCSVQWSCLIKLRARNEFSKVSIGNMLEYGEETDFIIDSNHARRLVRIATITTTCVFFQMKNGKEKKTHGK